MYKCSIYTVLCAHVHNKRVHNNISTSRYVTMQADTEKSAFTGSQSSEYERNGESTRSVCLTTDNWLITNFCHTLLSISCIHLQHSNRLNQSSMKEQLTYLVHSLFLIMGGKR